MAGADVGRRRPLSPTERRVVGLVADGLTQKAIAVRLGIGPRTVRKHLQRARIKCLASSTPNLIAIVMSAAFDNMTGGLPARIFDDG